MSLVFVDTSCLITLNRVDRLGLLPVVFPTTAAPPEVVDEFGWYPHWLTVMKVQDQRFLDTLQTQIDPGEAGVLDALVEANFRVSDRLYHEVLRLAGEHGQ